MALHVLIIDDEPILAQLFAEAFSDEGYRAESACDGRTGLRMLESGHHDLIVTDINMPVLDGFEIIRGIRRMGGDTKVLAVSGGGRLSSTQLLSLACKLGADASLAKPFSLDELVQLGAELLGHHKAHLSGSSGIF